MISNIGGTKEYPDGLTVRELKAAIKDWPEEDAYGEPTEVWVNTGEHWSSVITELSPLNKRRGEDGAEWADVLLNIEN